MKIAGIIMLAGLLFLSACDSKEVDAVFNREKKLLESDLNRERILRIGLQAYIDSVLNKDTLTVMHRMEHYAETLFEGKLAPAKSNAQKTAASKPASSPVAIQKLENELAGWVQKQAAKDWKLKEKGQNRLSLQINNSVLFEEEGGKVKEDAKKKLSELSQKLRANSNVFLYIEGHVDSLSQTAGGYWVEAWEQAQKVGDVFISSGFPVSRLSVASHGATAPLATNATEAGRYLNRRTMLILYVE